MCPGFYFLSLLVLLFLLCPFRSFLHRHRDLVDWECVDGLGPVWSFLYMCTTFNQCGICGVYQVPCVSFMSFVKALVISGALLAPDRILTSYGSRVDEPHFSYPWATLNWQLSKSSEPLLAVNLLVLWLVPPWLNDSFVQVYIKLLFRKRLYHLPYSVILESPNTLVRICFYSFFCLKNLVSLFSVFFYDRHMRNRN